MSGHLILIVEDNDNNRKLARDVLQFNGYRTTEAINAEDGIEIARSDKPDLVLMDIQLPRMDGIEAFRHLRTDPETGEIPVVAFTASVMNEDRQRILDAGFEAYLSKPISIKELLSTVGDVIAARGGPDAAPTEDP